jgi:hypothetical protein
MFEQLRLIVRNCEFRPSPDKSEARKGFFSQLYRDKNAEPRICQSRPFFGYFLWRSKESDSPFGEISPRPKKKRVEHNTQIPVVSFKLPNRRNTCGAV